MYNKDINALVVKQIQGKIMYRLLFLFLLGCSFSLMGENLLLNGSFENNIPIKNKRWQVEMFKEWTCNLNSSQQKCEITLVTPGFQDKQAVRLRTIGKEGFTQVVYKKAFDVSVGQEVTAQVMIKGKGTGYIRIYLLDANNKRKSYKMQGLKATPSFSKLFLKFTIPVGVAKIRYSLETLKDNADVTFDNASLEVSAGDVLENSSLRVHFNPRLGASINSFYWKEKNFEFTAPKTINRAGNLANCVIPARRLPGAFYNNNFTRKEITKNSITYTNQVTYGNYKGLTLTKKYTLNSNGVNVVATVVNNSNKEMALSWRTQNFINSDKGIWSWPTPDWVTIFAQTGAPLNGLNQVVHNIFRAKWQAKYFEKLNASLVIEASKSDVKQLYAWLSRFPGFSTQEFYYREFTLPVKGSHTVEYNITLVKDQKNFYADEIGKKQKFEKIEPIKLPNAPQIDYQSKIPENYFPYVGGNGNLNQYEMAGFHTAKPYQTTFAKITPRLFRRQVDGYINTYASGRLIYGNMHRDFWTKDGKHILGEMLNRFDLKYYLSTLFVHRSDVDVNKYMTEKWPQMHKLMTDKDLTKFINLYNKRMPFIFTADEILPQNIDVLLRVNEELRKILPSHIQPTPYLNSSAIDFINYVPVFIGDWYPIKRATSSDRNPWCVYTEFSNIVKKAKDTPVWFMPQGFASHDARKGLNVYAFPTAGETRLMLQLAMAAGVKGIAWHGFPSGTWIWMMNYTMYRYSFLGGAGQTTPSWIGVKDVGRAIASVGPILTKSKPEKLSEKVVVTCSNFTSKNKFYSGPAVKAYQLKTPNGKLYMIINQNPYSKEKCTVSLPEKSAFDMVNLVNVNPKNITLTLKSGDAAYIYCGNSLAELAPSFNSRFRAERARYLLQADIANGFGIKTIDPDKIVAKTSLDKVKLLLAQYAKLENLMTKGAAGAALKTLNDIKEIVNKIDFRLSCAWELAVPESLHKATKRYKRYGQHPDAKFQEMKNRLTRAFADYFAMTDAVENGGGFKAVKNINELKTRISQAANDVENWIQNHPEKAIIDDPYDGYNAE